MGTMDPKDKASDQGDKSAVNQPADNLPTGVTPTSTASVTSGLQQHPPPSPLSGCYLLIVLPEPHTAQHKELILNRLAKGFLSWDKDNCHVDLEKELQAIVAQSPEGEEARNGERLIQYATENLVTEILIHPQTNTLLQCMRNLLASFTKHRHIIHAGYTFQENGSWVLQDGTFSLADFLDAFSEHDVQRVLRAYENTVTVDINCAGISEWSTSRLSKEPCTRPCRIRLNPDDVLTSGVSAIVNFINYIEQYLVAQTLDQLMQPSDVVGNIRFSHPTLYVFPGGQGDAALFGINGFNMLVDGGFARKSCFWDFTRHLDRLDAVLFTRLNNSNAGGMSSVLRKKKEMHVYPQIGHFFCNLVERKHSNSPDGDKDLDPLIVSLTDLGQEMVINLKHINLRPHPCYRDNEPINLYHKVGHGTLDMYVLSPSKDSREVREFLTKWNSSDLKLFAGSQKKDLNNLVFPVQNMVSICALLVWQPANPEDTITRILFPGSTPQHKIFEGVDRLRHLEFLKHPTCSAKSISPTASLITLKEKSTRLKISQVDKETKRVVDTKKQSREEAEVKSAKPQSQSVKTKKMSALENKKLDEVKDYPKTIIETKEIKKIDKESKEVKREIKKEVIKDKDLEVKKTKVEDKTPVVSEPKMKMEKKKKETKNVKEIKVAPKVKKIEAKVEADKKMKVPAPKKSEVTKAPTPKALSKPAPKPLLPPAKSAKDANNRKVLEQKNKEKMSAKPKPAPPPPAASEKKPVVRRPKPISSPSKARLTGSPIKSVKSTPTSSIKSEKDYVVRKIKGEKGTADSSTVSTPSAIEVDSTKFIDKCLTEKSEDMSLDSIESKVLADLKEERQVVEEIEAVLQKAERIDDARKVQLEEDEIVDKKEEDMTEDDVTAEIDELPQKSTSRKPSHELTEDDEYLIIEKEEPYTEDSVHSTEAEHKHFLDTVQSEKVQKPPVEEKEKDETVYAKKAPTEDDEDEEVEGEIEEEEEGEGEGEGEDEDEPEEEYDEREDIEEVDEEEDEEEEDSEEKEVAVEKGIIEEREKTDVPEKKVQEVSEDEKQEETKDQAPISDYKEQLVEEVKEIITSATEIVQKSEDKDDSGKKDSDDVTKEGISVSPEKLDSFEKKIDTDVKSGVEKEHIPEKLEESQERISTIESGATTTAPTLPEDERIPVEGIKQVPTESTKPVVNEEIKKVEKVIEPKVMPTTATEISEVKPSPKPFTVRQTILPRDIVKTPDEVADLPVHEEVDPNFYKVDDFGKDKEEKIIDSKEPPPAAKEQKGVFSFFGKVADKFEKGIDKLTRKSRRDSEKDIDEKSSKSGSPKSKTGSPKESVEQLATEIKEEKSPVKEKIEEKKPLEKPTELLIDDKIKVDTNIKTEEIKKADEKHLSPKASEISEEDVGEVEALLEEASKKFKTVKDSLRDSLESLEDQIVEEELKVAKIIDEDEIKEKLNEVAEKLEEIKPQLEEEPFDREPEKVKFIIPKDEKEDEDAKDVFEHMEIIKDVREAVKDVGEVLAGTAGIRIDEKPKDVIEIVKKVAEVLKDDDFLSDKVLFEEKPDSKESEVTDAVPISTKKESLIETVSEKKESASEIVDEKEETVAETILKGKISINVEVPSRKESLIEEIQDQKDPIIESIEKRKDSIPTEVILEKKEVLKEGVTDEKESISHVLHSTEESSTAIISDEKDSVSLISERKESIVDTVPERKLSKTDIVHDTKELIAERKASVAEITSAQEKLTEAIGSEADKLLKEIPQKEETVVESAPSRKKSLVEVTAERKLLVDEAVLEKEELPTEVVTPQVAVEKKELTLIECHEEPCVKKVIDKEPIMSPSKEMAVDESDAKAICAELMKDDTSPTRRRKRSLGHYVEDDKVDVLEAGIEEICSKVDVHKDDENVKNLKEEIITSEISFDHKTSPAVAEVVMVTPDSMPPSPKFPVDIPQERETVDKESDDLNKIKVAVPKDIEDIVTQKVGIYEIVKEIILKKKIKITVEIFKFISETRCIRNDFLMSIINDIIFENNLTPKDVFDNVETLSILTEEKEKEEGERQKLEESEKHDVEDYIHKNYIEKHVRITWPILEEIATKKSLPVRMIIEIIEEIIIIRKVPRAAVLDISEIDLNQIIHEEQEKMDEKIAKEDEEEISEGTKLQLENELVNEYVIKGRKINVKAIEDLHKNRRISKRIIIEIIEEIIIKKKLKKQSIIDISEETWNNLKLENEKPEEEEEGKSVEEDQLVEGFIDVPSKDLLTKMQLEESEKDSHKLEIDDFEAVEQEYKLDTSQVEEAVEEDMHDVVEAEEKVMDTDKTQKPSTLLSDADKKEKLIVKLEEKDEDTSTVKRMVVTATSEDGGEETEICPTGSITFSKTVTPDDSLKGSPVRTTPDKDSLLSQTSSPEKDSISDKVTQKIKDSGKVTPDSLEKSLENKTATYEIKSDSASPVHEKEKGIIEIKEIEEKIQAKETTIEEEKPKLPERLVEDEDDQKKEAKVDEDHKTDVKLPSPEAENSEKIPLVSTEKQEVTKKISPVGELSIDVKEKLEPEEKDEIEKEKIDEKVKRTDSKASISPLISPSRKESLKADQKDESPVKTDVLTPKSEKVSEEIAHEMIIEETSISSTVEVKSPTLKESSVEDEKTITEDIALSTSAEVSLAKHILPDGETSTAKQKLDDVKDITVNILKEDITVGLKESSIIEKEDKDERDESPISTESILPTRKDSVVIEKEETKDIESEILSATALLSETKSKEIDEKEKAESIKLPTASTVISPIKKESLVIDEIEKAKDIEPSASPASVSPTRKESLVSDVRDKDDSIKPSKSPATLSPSRKESLVGDKEEKADSIKSSTSPTALSPTKRESIVSDEEQKAIGEKSSTSPGTMSPSKIECLVADEDDQVHSVQSTTSTITTADAQKKMPVIDDKEKTTAIDSSISPSAATPSRKESIPSDKGIKADSIKSETSPTTMSPTRKESLAVDEDDKAESIKSATSPAALSPTRKESLLSDLGEKADSIKSSTSSAELSPTRKESLVVDREEKADSIKSETSPAALSPTRKESLVSDKEDKADSIKSATSPAALSSTRKDSLVAEKDEEADSIKSATSPIIVSPTRKESLISDKEEKADSIKSSTSTAATSPTRKESLAIEKEEKADSIKSETSPIISPTRKESVAIEKDEKADSIKSSTSPAATSPTRKESMAIDKEEKADSTKSSTSPAAISPDTKEGLVIDKEEKADSMKSSTSPAAISPTRKESLVIDKEEKADSTKSSTSPAAISPTRKESLVVGVEEKADSIKPSALPAASPSRKESLIIDKEEKTDSIKSSTSPVALSPTRKESLAIEKEEKADSIKSESSPAALSPTRKESVVSDKEEKADSIKSSTSPAAQSPTRKESLVDKDEKPDSTKLSTSPAAQSPTRKESLVVDIDEKPDSIKLSTSPAAQSPTRKESLVVDIDENPDSIKSSTSPTTVSPTRKESLISGIEEPADSIISSTSQDKASTVTLSSPIRKESLVTDKHFDSVKPFDESITTAVIEKDHVISEDTKKDVVSQPPFIASSLEEPVSTKTASSTKSSAPLTADIPNHQEEEIKKQSVEITSTKSSELPTPTSSTLGDNLIFDEKHPIDTIKTSTLPSEIIPTKTESLKSDREEKDDSDKSSISPVNSTTSQPEDSIGDKQSTEEKIESPILQSDASSVKTDELINDKKDVSDSAKPLTLPIATSQIQEEKLTETKIGTDSLKILTSPIFSSTGKENLTIDKEEKADSIKSETSPTALSPARKESLVSDKEDRADSIKSATSPAALSPTRKESLVAEKDEKAESVKSSTSPIIESPIRKESLISDKEEKADSIKSSTSPAATSPTRKESLAIEKEEKADSIKSESSPAALSPTRKESVVSDKEEKADSIKSSTSPAAQSPTRKESLVDKDEKPDSIKLSTSPAAQSPTRKESLVVDIDEKPDSIKSSTSPTTVSPTRKESLFSEKDEKSDSIKSSTSPATLSPTRRESSAVIKDDQADSIKLSTSPVITSPSRKESIVADKADIADSIKSSSSPVTMSPTRKESLVEKTEEKKSSSSSIVEPYSINERSLPDKSESLTKDKETCLLKSTSSIRPPNLLDLTDDQYKPVESIVSLITKPLSPQDISSTDEKIKSSDIKSHSPASVLPTQKIEDSIITGVEMRKDSFSKSLEKSKDMTSTESLLGSKKDSFDEDEDLAPMKEMIPPKDRSRSQSLYETGEKTPLGRSRSASLYEEKDESSSLKQDQQAIQEHLAKYEKEGKLDDDDDVDFEVTLTKRTDIERYIMSQYVTRNKIITDDTLEEIVALYDVPSHIVIEIIEEICKKKNISRKNIFGQDKIKESESSHSETKDSLLKSLSFSKKLEIEDWITEHYIKPKKKMTVKIIEEIATSKGVPKNIIYTIIEFLIIDRKLTKELLVEEAEETDEEQDDKLHEIEEPVLISEKKRMEVESYVIEKYLNRHVIISGNEINEMIKIMSVPRFILLEIIEEIIKRMKIPRSAVYDEFIYSEMEYKERTLGHLSGKSTPDGKSSGYSTPEVRPYEEKHQSQFHKAFIGGITEIRTTHITTLSGKSTPDLGTRVDTPDSLPESTSDTKTTIQVQERSEPIIIKRTIVREVEEGEEEEELSASSKESGSTITKRTIIREGSPEYETVIKTTVVKKEIIEEDDQKAEKLKDQPEKKEVLPKEKIPTHKDHLEMLMSGERSGRSTPDKREGSEGRSSTATPEGFRSGEVIKTTIITTRTMSDDGDIITTTKEVTETTNELGETVVLAEKVDVKVADRGPLTSESILEPAKSSESLKTHGPSDDEPLNLDDESIEFSAEDMSSSFYGQLPSVPPPTRSDVLSLAGSSEDFTFKKATSEKLSDMGDYDVDQVLRDYQPPKKDDDSHSDAGSTTSKDPLKDWGTPLKLPPPERPDRFNLRSGALIHTVDISPDSLDFDIIHDWGEPMRLPSPAPVMDESNKIMPSTPKKEAKQPKKVISENVKNKKRSESPAKSDKKTKEIKKKIQPVYVDLTYVPHHGNSYYASLEFFKRVRARYYVFSGTEPSREVYDALLNAKKTWENKNLEVTMIPTYDTDTLGYWVADNEEALAINHIDLSPSASRCTINLQDHETSCSAYRLEF